MHPLALVTGASSGLGWEFAHLLAQDGYDLVVTARHQRALEELKQKLEQDCNVEVHVVAEDLAVRDGAKRVYEAVQTLHRPLDVLINNAGFGDYGYFHELDWGKQEGKTGF